MNIYDKTLKCRYSGDPFWLLSHLSLWFLKEQKHRERRVSIYDTGKKVLGHSLMTCVYLFKN